MSFYPRDNITPLSGEMYRHYKNGLIKKNIASSCFLNNSKIVYLGKINVHKKRTLAKDKMELLCHSSADRRFVPLLRSMPVMLCWTQILFSCLNASLL
jgi:hypothetical protein